MYKLKNRPKRKTLDKLRSMGMTFGPEYDVLADTLEASRKADADNAKITKIEYKPATKKSVGFQHFEVKVTLSADNYLGNVSVVVDGIDYTATKQGTTFMQNLFFATIQIDVSTPVKQKQNFKIAVFLKDGFGIITDQKSKDLIVEKDGSFENVSERKEIKDLKPSSKFYLWLKNKEGLGSRVIRDSEKEIIKILPYDDGGEMGKGNATIGYGHLIDYKPFDENNEKHKKWKNGITLIQAEELLINDVNIKIPLLANGLGDGATKGIKVKLIQQEYDALLMAIFNGGYGEKLENVINKGVEKLSKEEIFNAFLFRRNKGKSNERGLINRRASEASIFVYDNWMPYPNEKFKDYNEFILAYQKFLKNGVLPIILFFIICFLSCNKKVENKIIKPCFKEEYQKNELLNDKNDKLLSKMDTILCFSSYNFFYEVNIKKSNVDIKVSKWDEIPDGKITYHTQGFQKNGYVYTVNNKNEYELEYKIILNKGLFCWNGQNWVLVNSGNY